MRSGVVVAVAALAASVAAAAAVGSSSAFDAKWRTTAAKLKMPVFAPTKTAGLALVKVVPQQPKNCGQIKEQLDAYYQNKAGTSTLRIAEGMPLYCRDFGNAPLIAQFKLRKQDAFLLNYCEGNGCPAKNTFLLSWAERGVRIFLISRGITRASLLAVANSLRVVPG